MSDLTCDHCDEVFGNDEEFMEVQPSHLHNGEKFHDNMGWKVHWDEASNFIESLRDEYGFGGGA